MVGIGSSGNRVLDELDLRARRGLLTEDRRVWVVGLGLEESE